MVRTEYVGRVTCEARVENAIDGGDQPRAVPISDAVLDPRISSFALPTSMLRELGFTTPTTSWRPLYGPVRLWFGDRDITLDAFEVADGCPVLIGQIPLEHLQLVVNMSNHQLEKSTENGGEWILDAY